MNTIWGNCYDFIISLYSFSHLSDVNSEGMHHGSCTDRASLWLTVHWWMGPSGGCRAPADTQTPAIISTFNSVPANYLIMRPSPLPEFPTRRTSPFWICCFGFIKKTSQIFSALFLYSTLKMHLYIGLTFTNFVALYKQSSDQKISYLLFIFIVSIRKENIIDETTLVKRVSIFWPLHASYHYTIL